MKRSLLAAAAVLLISTAAAQALELSCNAPRVALGDDRDDNPVVGVEIKYKAEDHAWRIFHRLRNGLVVARAEQYAIQDWTNDGKTQWQGSLNRNRRLVMIGEVRQSANGVQYHESMYDRGKGGALVMQMTAQCTIAPAPSLPTPTAWAPVADSVPIYPANNGTSAMIDVLLGVQPLRMLLDTGATMCLISEAIAARIVRDGYGVWQEDGHFKMADGTTRTTRILLIKEVRIGGHTVHNVRASVSSTDEMLLAFPVVNDIAPFTIDTRAGLLIFHTSSKSGVVESIATEPVTSAPEARLTEEKLVVPTRTGPTAPPQTNQKNNVGKRTCVTLDGKAFEWPFANVPWKTLSCS